MRTGSARCGCWWRSMSWHWHIHCWEWLIHEQIRKNWAGSWGVTGVVGTEGSMTGANCRRRSSSSVRLRPRTISGCGACSFCAMQSWIEGVGKGLLSREGGSGEAGGARKISCRAGNDNADSGDASTWHMSGSTSKGSSRTLQLKSVSEQDGFAGAVTASQQ